jgi:hypothetical protein
VDKLMKASWRTFVFSLAALATIWDLARIGTLDPEKFLMGLAGILALYTTKQVIEFKKKQNGGTQ